MPCSCCACCNPTGPFRAQVSSHGPWMTFIPASTRTHLGMDHSCLCCYCFRCVRMLFCLAWLWTADPHGPASFPGCGSQHLQALLLRGKQALRGRAKTQSLLAFSPQIFSLFPKASRPSLDLLHLWLLDCSLSQAGLLTITTASQPACIQHGSLPSMPPNWSLS